VAKRTYRAESINNLDVAKLVEAVRDRRVTFAVDVAKRNMTAVLMEWPEKILCALSWKAPDETMQMVELVSQLMAVCTLDVALEPTGTYGDAIRGLMDGLGLAVYRVSPKRASDAAEIYDGVPSQHDAKCAAIIGWLHAQGRSERWNEVSPELRDLAAATDQMHLFSKQFLACLNRVEAKTARHFPEIGENLELSSATLLALLGRFGSPAAIANSADDARALMGRVGKALLSSEKVERILELARTTTGASMTEGERECMMALAVETDRQRRELASARKKVEELALEHASVRRVSEAVGRVTAAVLYVEAGDPSSYRSAAAYTKSLGLNLKIKNSGKPADQGQLKITKRGSSTARAILYMAVLRLIQTDPRFKAWYGRKVARSDGKYKGKALVALMRKLAKALWHVSRGGTFDSSKLFDDARLGLAA
jgi:hypothetical protein